MCSIVEVDGRPLTRFGICKATLCKAAAFFASRSAARVGIPFRSVTLVLQCDNESAAVHEAICGAAGATDVVTQRYDPIPGEEPGIYGEIYVNLDQAHRAAHRRRRWSPDMELLLYVAHGMDHLSGEDDMTDIEYMRMRRRELRWLSDWKSICASSNAQ